MQPRRVARELALLSISQLPHNPDKLDDRDLGDLLTAAVRALSGEVREVLELAAAELQRGHERLRKGELLPEEIRVADSQRSIATIHEAITLTEKAINRLGTAVDLPEMLQMAGQANVRDFALELVRKTVRNQAELDEILTAHMTGWTIDRLAHIDRDILRLSLADVRYIGTPVQVAVNEAVELAKKYSEADSYRFINGVLRRACGGKPAS